MAAEHVSEFYDRQSARWDALRASTADAAADVEVRLALNKVHSRFGMLAVLRTLREHPGSLDTVERGCRQMAEDALRELEAAVKQAGAPHERADTGMLKA